GGNALNAQFEFRSGFLCLTAVLASYLREQARRAEGALEHRLHEADLLNSATATLGASLAFEPALREVATAASHFFGSPCAVLVPSTTLDDDPLETTRIVSQHGCNPAIQEHLAALCNRYLEPEVWETRGERTF